MLDIQACSDGISAQWEKDRAATQMTLGRLIKVLEAMSPDAPVANLHSPHSYRGYYGDLAFERVEGTQPASELLATCKSAMGQVFAGYRGGDFVMGALAPVWVAKYGDCGEKIIALENTGEIITKQDDYN